MTGNFSEAGVPGKIQFGSAWWFNDHIDGMEQQMVCAPTKIAPTLANDREAIKAAIKTCNILDFTKVKMVRIKNTLEIGEIEVSAALHDYVKNHPQLEVLTESAEWIFDKDGNLTK